MEQTPSSQDPQQSPILRPEENPLPLGLPSEQSGSVPPPHSPIETSEGEHAEEIGQEQEGPHPIPMPNPNIASRRITRPLSPLSPSIESAREAVQAAQTEEGVSPQAEGEKKEGSDILDYIEAALTHSARNTPAQIPAEEEDPADYLPDIPQTPSSNVPAVYQPQEQRLPQAVPENSEEIDYDNGLFIDPDQDPTLQLPAIAHPRAPIVPLPERPTQTTTSWEAIETIPQQITQQAPRPRTARWNTDTQPDMPVAPRPAQPQERTNLVIPNIRGAASRLNRIRDLGPNVQIYVRRPRTPGLLLTNPIGFVRGGHYVWANEITGADYLDIQNAIRNGQRVMVKMRGVPGTVEIAEALQDMGRPILKKEVINIATEFPQAKVQVIRHRGIFPWQWSRYQWVPVDRVTSDQAKTLYETSKVKTRRGRGYTGYLDPILREVARRREAALRTGH